jgi:hypothetical protein
VARHQARPHDCDLSFLDLKPSSTAHRHEYRQEDLRVLRRVLEEGVRLMEEVVGQRLSGALAAVEEEEAALHCWAWAEVEVSYCLALAEAEGWIC